METTEKKVLDNGILVLYFRQLNRSEPMYLLIDLYTKKSKLISAAEQKEHCAGVKPKKGAKLVWDLEEYIIVEI